MGPIQSGTGLGMQTVDMGSPAIMVAIIFFAVVVAIGGLTFAFKGSVQF